jgi:phenylpropionate dioxygenase-like ring-hydroxylating dioxygenase large terminal subunit
VTSGPTSVRDLVSRTHAGYTLAQDFYCRPDIFARDLDLLLGRWICAGHASEIPRTGDYRVVELGRDSAIVIRQTDGGIGALANVCRHRGSRICTRPHGRAAILTCPYHAWTYHLDGTLRQAREMPADFDRAAHGLLPLPAAVIGGLIFISFGDDPPALAPGASALEMMTTAYGWENARVAQRRSYTVAANWKLVLENYHECYHCAPAHPEFSALHALAEPGNRQIGAADRELWSPVVDGAEMVRVMHSGLARGVQTGSRDGAALAPRMGQVQAGGGCVFAELGFLSAFLAYPDYGVIYRFIPRDVLRTDMEVLWLVHGDAQPGADYDPDALVWLWDVTSLADKTIIERNQDGVLSRAYRPGPFSLMEPGTRAFVERYVSELAALHAA